MGCTSSTPKTAAPNSTGKADETLKSAESTSEKVSHAAEKFGNSLAGGLEAIVTGAGKAGDMMSRAAHGTKDFLVYSYVGPSDAIAEIYGTGETLAQVMEKGGAPVVGVFPATSNVGIATLKHLTQTHRTRCTRIVCIVKDETGIARIRKALGSLATDSLSFAFADFNDDMRMNLAFMNLDRLFLIAPATETRGDQVVKAIRSANTANVRHLVVLSTIGAPNKAIRFDKDFAKVEEALKTMPEPHPAFTILECGVFMENFLGNAKTIAENGCFYSNAQDGQWAPVAVDDIGKVAAIVLAEPKTSNVHHTMTYKITGPALLSSSQIAAIFSKVLQRKIEFRNVPDAPMAETLTQFVPKWLADGVVELNALIAAGKVAVVSDPYGEEFKIERTSFEKFVQTNNWIFNGAAAPTICIVMGDASVGIPACEKLVANAGARVQIIALDDKVRNQVQGHFADKVSLVDGFTEASMKEAFKTSDRVLIIPSPMLQQREIVALALKLANEASVMQIVLVSIPAETKESPVGAIYKEWETAMQGSSTYTILNVHPMMNLVLGLAPSVKNGSVENLYGGSVFAPVDPTDVGSACAIVLLDGPVTHGNKRYTFSGPETTNFVYLMQMLSTILKKEIKVAAMPSDPAAASERVRQALVEQQYPENVLNDFVKHELALAKHPKLETSSQLGLLLGKLSTFSRFVEQNKEAFAA